MAREWGFLGAALAAAAMALLSGSAPGQDRPPTLYAAHRGGALLWPENSLLAFRNAAALGADYLELDVHLSRDGEVVVIHDPTLDRTTTGTGPVKDRTLAELRGLRLRDRSGAVTAETIPTLDEVIRLAAESRRQLLLEIKVDPGRQRYPGIEEKALALLDRHRMAAATVVMAFEAETWRRVRGLRPDLRAGALYSPRMLERSGATLASVMDEARQAGVAFIGLHQALVDRDAVALARRAGLALGVWTVNEPEAIRHFIALGAGIVITDRPDLARELLGR
jgi:glycerophosphoryl diester phosphodiesterase